MAALKNITNKSKSRKDFKNIFLKKIRELRNKTNTPWLKGLRIKYIWKYILPFLFSWKPICSKAKVIPSQKLSQNFVGPLSGFRAEKKTKPAGLRPTTGSRFSRAEKHLTLHFPATAGCNAYGFHTFVPAVVATRSHLAPFRKTPFERPAH